MKQRVHHSFYAVLCLAASIFSFPARANVTVIDYYRLGDADAGAINGGTVTATTADSLGTKPLIRIGTPTYTNNVSAGAALRESSQLAVSFSGTGQGLSNAVVSTVVDNFGVEAWARPNVASGTHSIVYNGNTGTSGWGIYQSGSTYEALLGGVSIFGAAPITLNGWSHVALVRASGTNTLYVNGVAVASVNNAPAAPVGGFGVGMPGQALGTEAFNGQIDEVRVFTFAAGQFSTNDLLFNSPSMFTMKASLQTDGNANGGINAGDGLRYTVVITNNTGTTLTNLVFNAPVVTNAPLVVGSLKASPLARADGPVSNSVPGNAFHGAFNTTLNLTAGSGLLANDFTGSPAATIISFGGGSFGANVSAHAAGTSANTAGIGNLTVNADGSVTFVPATGFTGPTTFQYRLANSVGTNDGTVTLAIGNRAAVTNDAYLVTGNTTIDTSLIPQSVLTNDLGDGLGLSGNTAPAHGAVSLSANGHFIYTPNAAYVGADSFTYTLTNGFGGVVGTVNLTVTNRIWYVDNSVASNGDGRSTTPFKQISPLEGANISGPLADGDLIFMRQGSSRYLDSSLELRAGQRLFGDGFTGSFGPVFGFSLAPGSAKAAGVAVPGFTGVRPNFNPSSGTPALFLNSNNVVAGLDVNASGPSSRAFSATVAGNLVISNCSVSASHGSVMTITTSGALNVVFDSASSTNSNESGLNLANVTGSITINGGTILNPTAAAVLISGGSVTLTCGAAISQANNAPLVAVTNHTSGTLTFQTGALAASNGSGLNFNNADGVYNFNSAVTLNGGAAMINIENGSAGNFSFLNAPITNPSGTAFRVNGGSGSIGHAGTITKNSAGLIVDIQGRTGGSVTLNGSLAQNSASGTGINVSSCSGGTVTFSGASKTLNTSANTAVTLASNTGATVDFSNGGLAITTTSGNGFNVSGGATAISVQGTGNTISSTTGTALNVANTTIGASGLTFQSISASGAANGIVLNNTGTSGGLTVTGTDGADAGTVPDAGTGGTIQNCTSHGVSLTTATDVRLGGMNIINNLGSGISGSGINGFVLDGVTITGNGNDAATDESGINVTQLSGTVAAGAHPTAIRNSTIRNNNEFEVQISDSSGTLADFQFQTNVVSANGLPINGNASSPHGSLVNFLATGSASMTLNAAGGSFTGNTDTTGGKIITGTAIFGNSGGANLTVNVSSASFTSNNAAIDCSTDPLNTILTFNLIGNTMIGSRAVAINHFDNGNPPFARTVNGRIMGNVIGTLGVAGSGSAVGNGISIQNEGAAPASVVISNNIIQECATAPGVSVNVGLAGLATGGGLTSVTIKNNTIRNIGSRGIAVQDNQDTAPFPTVCANISGNVFSGIAGQAGNGQYMRVRRLNGTYNVTQGTPTASAIATELDDANGFNDPTKINVSGTINFSQPACGTP